MVFVPPLTSITLRIARTVARRINATLDNETRAQFARYAAQHIGLQVMGRQVAVWKLDERGAWVAVSPLIDADVVVQWNGVENGDGIAVRGNAGLLKVLANYQQSLDIPVLVVESFGPTLAPHLFYAWAAARHRWQAWKDDEVVSPELAEAQQKRAAAVQQRLTKLLKKVEQLENS